MKKVNFGCGSDVRSGWINIDMLDNNHPDYIKHNLLEGIPANIKNIDFIYSAHCLEHFYYQDAIRLLTSCRESLNPGGVIRICLPNFSSMCKAYVNNDWEFFNLPEVMVFSPNKNMMEIMNYGLYQHTNGENEHKCMYDPSFAILTLQKVGFFNVKEVDFNSEYDIDLEVRKRYSFYVEGIK